MKEDEETPQTRFYQILEDVIDRAFQQSWSKPGRKRDNKDQTSKPIYESIEDYKEQTGKRFRMTRDQKSRGLSREEAFKEIHGNT
jgi:hypothetical protein